MPHLVKDHDLTKVGARAKAAGEKVTGDADQGFKDADVVHEGEYGIPVITHCCLESHGQAMQWSGDAITFWPSTQNVSDIGGKPVKLFLDRATELTIAGVRPSAYAKIKIGAKKDGTITSWQSDSWASGGFGGGNTPPLPYVYTGIPNQRKN